MAKHSIHIRDALIKLLEDKVPESYKAGSEVLQSILGSDDVTNDKPILCFDTNSQLTVIANPGVAPIVWETKAMTDLGCKTVLDPIESTGQELLIDFLSIYFKFKHNLWYILVHTLYILYVFDNLLVPYYIPYLP
jgi:hypothetical protein